MKNKNKKKTENNKQQRFVSSTKKKINRKKSRHSDKRAVKDLQDIIHPDEYDDYSDYVGWNDD